VLITNAAHDALTADLRGAEADLDGAQAAHRAVPTRLPLSAVNPGQQVLDTQTKLLTHAIRMAAFITDTVLARAVRVYTGYARADDEAHNLVRQALPEARHPRRRRSPPPYRSEEPLLPPPPGRSSRCPSQSSESVSSLGGARHGWWSTNFGISPSPSVIGK